MTTSTSIVIQLLGSITLGHLAATLFLVTIGSFLYDFALKPKYPKSLPWAGYGSGLAGSVKNWFKYVTEYNNWAAQGYDKYSKHGRSYIVPSAPSRTPNIVVPRSQTSWLLDLPENVVSTKAAHGDILYNYYQFFQLDDQFPIRTVHKHLARNITGLIPAVQDEIKLVVDAFFGADTETWKSVNLWDAWLHIVPQVTNRIVVGAPTCRNREFLRGQVGFADAIVTNSFILNMFPTISHPVVARLVTLTNWWNWRKSYKIVKPVIEQRIHDMVVRRQATASGGGGGDDESRDDYHYHYQPEEENMITWLIRQALAEGLEDEELNSEMISKRLLPVEFAAIHTTVLTGHTLLLDLLTSNPAQDVLEVIRRETTEVFRQEGKSHWTKQSLARLHRTDSAIKESMRVSTFATTLTQRKVVAKEGLTSAAEGWHAPHGSFLMLNMAGTHHDPELYENPDMYDAFRFSRAREGYEAKAAAARLGERGDDDKKSELSPDEAMKTMRLGMVTTSEVYLPFSHGRHACPGRFFVAHELKMILAYLLQNYELKHLEERPKPMWIGQTIVPPLEAKIEIRRRKGTV